MSALNAWYDKIVLFAYRDIMSLMVRATVRWTDGSPERQRERSRELIMEVSQMSAWATIRKAALCTVLMFIYHAPATYAAWVSLTCLAFGVESYVTGGSFLDGLTFANITAPNIYVVGTGAWAAQLLMFMTYFLVPCLILIASAIVGGVAAILYSLKGIRIAYKNVAEVVSKLYEAHCAKVKAKRRQKELAGYEHYNRFSDLWKMAAKQELAGRNTKIPKHLRSY